MPQQVHLDVMVEDLAAAEPHVLALGARKLDGQDVYAEPAGHPFCLIRHGIKVVSQRYRTLGLIRQRSTPAPNRLPDAITTRLIRTGADSAR